MRIRRCLAGFSAGVSVLELIGAGVSITGAGAGVSTTGVSTTTGAGAGVSTTTGVSTGAGTSARARSCRRPPGRRSRPASTCCRHPPCCSEPVLCRQFDRCLPKPAPRYESAHTGLSLRYGARTRSIRSRTLPTRGRQLLSSEMSLFSFFLLLAAFRSQLVMCLAAIHGRATSLPKFIYLR